MLTYDDFCKGWNGKLLGKADARDVFDFLSQPENINQMIVMSDHGLPALGGVVKTLESKFANAANFSLSEKEHRKDVGAMVKRILVEFGYETVKLNPYTKAQMHDIMRFMGAKLFKTSHVYEKKGVPVANLKIHIV